MIKNKNDVSISADVLSPTAYCEKMTSLIVKNYDQPEECFVVARKVFKENYENWSSMEQIKAVMSLFRDAYRAYANEEKRKLGDRFLAFTKGLNLEPTTFSRLYESFLFLIKKRPEGLDFICKAITYDCYMDVINEDIVNEYSSYDTPIYRDLFIRRIQSLADYLYDTTYLYIAKNMTDRYTMYDDVIYALLERKKDIVIASFLANANLLISKECLDKIVAYAKKNDDSSLLKAAYHTLLFKGRVTFTDFMGYYMLLSPQERNENAYSLERIIQANHLEKAYGILSGKRNDATVLRGLSLEEFALLSDIIKEKYPDKYQKYILQAIDRKTEKFDSRYDDLFACLEKYPEDIRVFLEHPGIKKSSLYSEKFRYQYLKMLKQQDMLSKAEIKYYRG
ncbi:MAG: hypothetical protein K5762_00435 [Bacilli bacterium]|nr:hypothetical protein [Bacilli bacterium]